MVAEPHGRSASADSTPSHVLQAARNVASAALARAFALDVDGGFPLEDIRHLHTTGLLHAPFSQDDVGFAADDLMRVLVALGSGSLALARLYEGHVNAVSLVVRYGTAANLDLMRAEADAGRICAVWMAGEPLRLDQQATTPVLVGGKILCSGAGHVRRPLVAADTADGSIMLIPSVADVDRADARGWISHGMRATATGSVDFNGIVITPDEIVGKPGDYLRSPYFRGGAWRVIAAQLGGLEAIFGEYRRQLASGPHRDHPLQLARFGEAAIAAETARLWVREACERAEGGGDADAIDAYVDLARNAFERAALEVIAGAQKAIGLKALLRPNPLERMIRDLSTYMRQPALDLSLMAGARHQLARETTTG